MTRTLLYTANTDSIDTFFGPGAHKHLQAIYNADDRINNRREIRNGDPDNGLEGELFVLVDEDGNKDHDLTTEIGNMLIECVAARRNSITDDRALEIIAEEGMDEGSVGSVQCLVLADGQLRDDAVSETADLSCESAFRAQVVAWREAIGIHR